MTFQDLGGIGELIGGIGVIATLLYLAAQIRANTRSVRVSNHQEVQRGGELLCEFRPFDYASFHLITF
jgi:hypothetical protein